MEFAVEQVLQTAEQEGSREIRADHARADGWYSSEAIAAALTTTSMKKRGRVEYTMSLKPLYKHPEEIHRAVGAVVNVDDRHWVAIRSQGGEIWLLDSQERRPIRMTREAYHKFVAKRRAAYPIHWATDMSQLPSSAAASSSASSSQTPVLPLESQTLTQSDAETPVDVEMAPAGDGDIETRAEKATAVPMDGVEQEVTPAQQAPLGQTSIPTLMVAEQISADDAQAMIMGAHMERGYELEALAMEARSEYMAALEERGGH